MVDIDVDRILRDPERLLIGLIDSFACYCVPGPPPGWTPPEPATTDPERFRLLEPYESEAKVTP